jgi:hypothetical protein
LAIQVPRYVGKRGSRFSKNADIPSRHSGPSTSIANVSNAIFRAVFRSTSPHILTANLAAANDLWCADFKGEFR